MDLKCQIKVDRYNHLIILLFLLFSSCSIISFTESDYRPERNEPLELDSELKISPTGEVFMNMAGIMKADFFSAGFRIDYGDQHIYLDPLVVKDSYKADLIFITHAHADHFSRKDIEKLSSENTILIGPRSVTKKLKDIDYVTAKPGDTIALGNISCEVVHSYNIKRGFFHSPLHSRSENYLGYIISFGSSRIYIAGDTDLIPEMRDFEDITVALIPVGVGKTAMSPREAAEAVNLIEPQIAVPMHYDLSENGVEEFIENVKEGIQVVTFLDTRINKQKGR